MISCGQPAAAGETDGQRVLPPVQLAARMDGSNYFQFHSSAGYTTDWITGFSSCTTKEYTSCVQLYLYQNKVVKGPNRCGG